MFTVVPGRIAQCASPLQDDAERLYLKSGRHDLLNKFYQACGNWQKVVLW